MEIPSGAIPTQTIQPTQASLTALKKINPQLTAENQNNIQVVVKKKGFWSKLVANDWDTIRASVVSNVVIPGIKTFIANVIYGLTNATLFKGGVAGSGNYWNYYQSGKPANVNGLGWNPLPNNSWSSLKPQQTSNTNYTSLSDYKLIEFNSIEDAQTIFNYLIQRIVEYGKVSVSYLFEKCNLSSNDATHDNWGWYDLNCGFQITPLANGRYHLNLPDPVNFNINR